MDKGAVIVGEYRYLLWRVWDTTRPRLLWILLNPSVADGERDDPTLRRCTAFSDAWGYGALEIVNLFAYRTTDKSKLSTLNMDPIGPENDEHILAAASHAPRIIVGWGADGALQMRDRAVLAALCQHAQRSVDCLGVVRNGCPRHPLYIPGDTLPIPYAAYS